MGAVNAISSKLGKLVSDSLTDKLKYMGTPSIYQKLIFNIIKDKIKKIIRWKAKIANF